MHRFFCPNKDLSTQHTAAITDKNELHHLRDVLRLKKGAAVTVFNGNGLEASGELSSVSADQAVVRIATSRLEKRIGPTLILACALPKKSKFELIVEKATELGADEIIPLITKRTEIKLSGDRLDKKRSRYETVAINAAKQSRRAFVPRIHPVTEFNPAVKSLCEQSVVIMPSLTGKTVDLLSAMEKVTRKKRVSFLIGPEGDFTAEEYTLAHQNGCIPVTLGKTILRVETAAICTLSCATLSLRRLAA